MRAISYKTDRKEEINGTEENKSIIRHGKIII